MALPSTLPPGTILDGKFRIEKVLGEGGMGVVARAMHLRMGHPVALKFLLPSAVGHPQVAERFEREGRAAARLIGEHVARVLDVGTLSDGSPYIVMEYLEGESFSAIYKRGRLPIAEACRYLVDVCDALAEAHAAGIVHRDLKLANLFLAVRPDGKRIVKVLDFGISKLREDGLQNELTSTQTILGTPFYMAPEQFVSSRTVDARADLWSCGVCLYAMLAGELPFDGDSALELAMKATTTNAPDVRAARPEVPAGLAAVVAGCLQRDLSRRFQTAQDLARALEPFTVNDSQPNAPAAPPALAPLVRLSTQPLPPAARAQSPQQRHVEQPTNVAFGMTPDARTASRTPAAALIGACIGGLVLGICGLGWAIHLKRTSAAAAHEERSSALSAPVVPMTSVPSATSAIPPPAIAATSATPAASETAPEIPPPATSVTAASPRATVPATKPRPMSSARPSPPPPSPPAHVIPDER